MLTYYRLLRKEHIIPIFSIFTKSFFMFLAISNISFKIWTYANYV